MKIVLFTFCLLFFSCNNQEKNKVLAKIKTENLVEPNILLYNDWYRSVVECVQSQTQIKNYEKENVLSVLQNIPEKNYVLLQQHSKEIRENEGFKELFIFRALEGELITNKLYYFYSDCNIVKKASIQINVGRLSFEPPTIISSPIFREIDIISINNENQYQDIIVFTESIGNDVVSKLGNPNHNLIRVLE